MNSAWYSTYFGEEYWQLAESWHAVEQTTKERAYLQDVLQQAAPGRRVVELGCGVGYHAVALAQAGYEVTGLDISAWAIEEARRRSASAGVDVRWAVINPMEDTAWPLAQADAVVCLDAFGWGTDADQRRLLRRIRSHLVPEGILLITCANLSWFLRQAPQKRRWRAGKKSYTFEQTYDPVCGRSRGTLTVATDGQVVAVHPYDLRHYSVAELMSLLQASGFRPLRLDADFDVQGTVGMDTRSIQICARSLTTPPMSLAVSSWRTPTGQPLDLRYAPDEADWLDPSPRAIWIAFLEAESHLGADLVDHYPVDDPYGSKRAAPVVSAYFGCSLAPQQVTLGPGVTSLLHDLSGLADGGLILASQLVHPDLTAWALARGGRACFVEGSLSLDGLIAEVRTHKPALVQLDRPNLFDRLISLDDLYALGVVASEVGAVVLVDESPATYLGPAGSAVSLLNHLDNLVILRGLTKAYSWGGLRVGFALSSQAISARVRELVCPLQVGELALGAALQLLKAGDSFGPLRDRIHAVKPVTTGMFSSLGLTVQDVHPDVPWVVVPDTGRVASQMLAGLGIQGLRFVPSPALQGPYPEKLLLFSPLSDERLAMLRERLVGSQTEVTLSFASDE